MTIVDLGTTHESATRLLAGLEHTARLGLEDHLRVHGALDDALAAGRTGLLELADAVDLRGRGGAAFSFARKARSVRESSGNALVVGNGSEGEPASRKDAWLMTHAPHLVLDGLELAASAVGARDGRLVVGSARAVASLEHAAAERRRLRAGLGRVRTTIVAVADRFVGGESSAAVRAAGGAAALPVFSLTRTSAGGVNGRPTLVSNVETLAQLAVLARLGVDRYRAVGTTDEPGTTLLTVHRTGGPVVVEVAYGCPLSAVVPRSEVGPGVLVGGYHGTWVPAARFDEVRLSVGALRQIGAALGAGVLLPLPPGACPLAEAAPAVRLMAQASAGQCGPCVHGLAAIADRVEALAAGRSTPEQLALLDRYRRLVPGRGACGHPDGVVRFVGSLLSAFPTEVAMHQHRGCGRPSRGLLPLAVHR